MRLKVEISFSAENISDAAVEHVRAFLAARELGKVRIHADSGAECEQAAAELARACRARLFRASGGWFCFIGRRETHKGRRPLAARGAGIEFRVGGFSGFEIET